jgi:hypothetical protein
VLGQRVADLARAFGMVPMFAAHKGRSGLGPLYTPWQEVIETSDVITLHSPLTKETRGMIAMPEFEAMKRRPLIVNTARGGLVDEAALVRALDAGLIAGAGFDVVDGEPPKPDNPLMRAAARHNVILTPHVAWASDEAQQAWPISWSTTSRTSSPVGRRTWSRAPTDPPGSTRPRPVGRGEPLLQIVVRADRRMTGRLACGHAGRDRTHDRPRGSGRRTSRSNSARPLGLSTRCGVDT